MYPFCFLVARRGYGVLLTESGVGRVGHGMEEKKYIYSTINFALKSCVFI